MPDKESDMGRRILREGDKGWAPHPTLPRLTRITYRVVPLWETQEGWLVRGALLGVCDETGEVLAIPHVSAPLIGQARRDAEGGA
jgi:hypothetical protein